MGPAAWISVATVCAAGAISPGPSFAVVVRNTISGGRRQGILTGIGHALGVGVYAMAAVFGVGFILDANPESIGWVERLGGIYLLYLGLQALRFAGQSEANEPVNATARGFADGMAISILNPKIAIFFMALLGPMLPIDIVPIERFGVAMVAMVVDGVWFVFAAVALSSTGATEWLADKSRWMDYLLGLVLVSVGAWLLAHQFTL